MKNQILLIICLLASVVANAQIEIPTVTAPPAASPGDCNCYKFTVDPIYPFYEPQVSINGYDYFWIWGDGTHTAATSPNTVHCYNSNVGSNNVTLELTPRKRPNDEDKIYASYPLEVESPGCLIATLPYSGMQIRLSSEPKVDKDFIVAVQSNGCEKGNTILKFDYDESVLEYVSTYCIHSHSQNSGSIDFSLSSMQVETHYFRFHVKEDVLEGTPILFKLKRKSVNINEKTDRNFCNDSIVLPALITSGPYDPNLITPSLGENLTDCNISKKWITYSLQFKNEGNGATKEKVKVVLLLDPRLDQSTLEIVNVRNQQNASWPKGTIDLHYDTTHLGVNTGSVQVVCHKMILASKHGADSNSMGYITYRIKVKDNVILVPGDSLKTSADVYFDYEDKVKTNIAVTSCAKEECKTSCCCSKCKEKPWYMKYSYVLIGSFLVAAIYLWYRRKN